jgi:phospholipid/cholesterol/gamma-HCH transport system permease protein
LDLVRKPLVRLGARGLRFLTFVGELGLMLRQAAGAAPRLVFVRRGRRLAWDNLWFQLYRVGVRSIGVVSLVTICIGAILALQIGPILRTYGAVSQLPTVIGIAMFRELGPLIGAIVLTGFAGASMAAELGTMAVSEEIKALKAHAISPVRFLVVPRVIATVFMTVCLANLSNLMGVLGGMLIAYLTQGIALGEYYRTTFEAIDMYDWITGLIKAGVFGMLISGLACYLGMNVRGGAEGVGLATTRTVVISIVSLICTDLIFTFVFFRLDF